MNPEEILRNMGMTDEQLESLRSKANNGQPCTVIEFLGELEDFATALNPETDTVKAFDDMVNLLVCGITASSHGQERTFRVTEDRSVVWLTKTRNEWMGLVMPVMMDIFMTGHSGD